MRQHIDFHKKSCEDRQMKNEILEIETERTYNVQGLELTGKDLIHKVANGLRYEEISEHFKGSDSQ